MRSDGIPTLVVNYTIKKYCCATCYADLTEITRPDEDGKAQRFIVCTRYPDEHYSGGYVTKYHRETQREQSLGDYMNVRKDLIEHEVIENEHAGKKADELLGELGF